MKSFRLDRTLKSFALHFTAKDKPSRGPAVTWGASREFTGARSSRLEMDWHPSSTSADAELVSAITKLRNRSRDLLRNNDYARGAVAVIVNNVIGQGIRFQAQIPRARGAGVDDRRNEALEYQFKRWSRSCDTTGRLSFCQFQRLALRSLIESGEVFIRKHYNGPNIPFTLELIEADRVEVDYGLSPSQSASGDIIKMGIEQDPYGRPRAYYLRRFHPGDIVFHPRNIVGTSGPYSLERVPADQIIHLFIPDRPGQSRGIPWMTSSLQRLRNLGGYEEAELVAARASAAVMGFRVTKDPDLTERDSYGDPVDSLEPGTIKELAPGEEFIGFDPSRPNQSFEPFIHACLRGLAANLGVDFESISRDFSQSNYSSSRLALLQVRETYQSIQAWFIESFCQPVLEEWLDAAVLSGALQFADYELNPDRYSQVRWRPRGWSWVDPAKETEAAVTAIDYGLSTLTRELAKQGLDLEEVLQERARELQLAQDLGLSIGPPEEEDDLPTLSDSRAFSRWLSHLIEDELDED